MKSMDFSMLVHDLVTSIIIPLRRDARQSGTDSLMNLVGSDGLHAIRRAVSSFMVMMLTERSTAQRAS